MAKIDYEYKAQILNGVKYKEFKEINKAIYNFNYNKHLPCKYSYDEALDKSYELFQDDYQGWKECFKLDHAFLQKKKRLKERLTKMLQKDCVFCTFTFSDEWVNKPIKNLKKYLTQVLRQMSDVYIANEDYGKQTERLHFHAIVQAERVDMSLWKYGFMYAEKISNKDPVKLSVYITKLGNHAIKASNKRSVMIYSKRVE